MSGLASVPPAAKLTALRAALKRDQAVRLPGLLDAKLFDIVFDKLARAKFRDVMTKNKDRRGTPVDTSLNAFMIVLFSDPRFFRVVESLSGCPRIERLTGGIYRMEPGAGHYLRWHGDLGKTSRVMTMTVNLGREPVVGGCLEIKRTRAKTAFARFPYERGGDAILMRLAPGLRHRSAPVTGTAPKTIFSCWFHAAERAS